jgi:hypothetical protein
VVLGTGIVGVGCQVQVFALIIFYSRHFSSGELIHFAGYTLDPRSSLELLAAGSLSVLLLLGISAVCVYVSRNGTLRMGSKYEEYCAKRVFFLLGRHTGIPVTAGSGQCQGVAFLQRLVKGDARMCGRVLCMMMSLIVPGITLLCCVSVLFYLEAGLTLIIAVLGLIYLFCQYKVSRKVLEHSIRFERLAPLAGRELKQLIQHCKYQSHTDENRKKVENSFSSGPVRNQLDAFEGRLRATENSRLVSGLFMAVIVSLIILALGGSIIREGSGWGRLLVYVVALRFAMVNLQTMFTILTSINRFYPQMIRNYQFVISFQDHPNDPGLLPETYELHVKDTGRRHVLKGTRDPVIIHPGSRLALVTPQDMNRYALAQIMGGLLGEKAGRSAIFSVGVVTFRQGCPQVPLRRLLGLSGSAGWKDVLLPEDLVSRLKGILGASLDIMVKPGLWEKMGVEDKFAISLVAALNSDCQWMILEEKGLYLLTQKYPCDYLAGVNNKIVVIAFQSHITRVGQYSEDQVAVMDENGLIGLGSLEWFTDVRPGVRDMLQYSKKRYQAGGNDMEEDIDEM